ncbi:hypothetical protein TNCV_4830601 [Trichonephila clavipes]|nr:hypothetical protein TNCV_4830601 [Trichonephila clavipes]
MSANLYDVASGKIRVYWEYPKVYGVIIGPAEILGSASHIVTDPLPFLMVVGRRQSRSYACASMKDDSSDHITFFPLPIEQVL